MLPLSNLCDYRVRPISAYLADSSSSSRSAERFWFITLEYGAIVLLKFNCGNIYGGREKRCSERKSDKGTPFASRRTDIGGNARDTKTVSFSEDRGEITVRDERANCRRKMRFLHSRKTTIVENVAEKRGWQSEKKKKNRGTTHLAASQLSNQDARDINRVVKAGARCQKWCTQ